MTAHDVYGGLEHMKHIHHCMERIIDGINMHLVWQFSNAHCSLVSGTSCYLDEIASTFGIEVTYVNSRDLGYVEQAIKTTTKVFNLHQ